MAIWIWDELRGEFYIYGMSFMGKLEFYSFWQDWNVRYLEVVVLRLFFCLGCGCYRQNTLAAEAYVVKWYTVTPECIQKQLHHQGSKIVHT